MRRPRRMANKSASVGKRITYLYIPTSPLTLQLESIAVGEGRDSQPDLRRRWASRGSCWSAQCCLASADVDAGISGWPSTVTIRYMEKTWYLSHSPKGISRIIKIGNIHHFCIIFAPFPHRALGFFWGGPKVVCLMSTLSDSLPMEKNLQEKNIILV